MSMSFGIGSARRLSQGTLGENWSWSVFGLARAAYWRGNGTENRELADLSGAPVAHLERRMRSKLALYVDGSVGLHLLSHTKSTKAVSSAQRFSSESLSKWFRVGPCPSMQRRAALAAHFQRRHQESE
jgi:hypothetical protein